ncbi:MAG: AI-2E family transporter, partial [Gammaproteobacteria bacterium]|nr:AI-2E family transporter [Gammaproteobacteria bacterium]
MSDTKKWMILFVIAILGLFVYRISSVLTPFLVAAILAYLTNSWVVFLQKLHIGRTWAVVIVFLILLGLFILSLIFLIPALEQQLINFITALPNIIARIKNVVLPWVEQHFDVNFDLGPDGLQNTLQNTLQGHWQQAGQYLPNIFKTFAGSSLVVIGFFTSLLLIPVVLFYLLRDWDRMLAAIHALIPRRIEPVTVRLLKECDAVLSGFLRGQLLVMIA